MANPFLGANVSIKCFDGLGVYQGSVLDVNSENQSICLGKPFKNGFACTEPQIVLSAHIIESIKIVENIDEPDASVASTIVVPKPVPKRAHRPVSENIAHFKPNVNTTPNKQFAKPAPKLSESPRKALNDADTFQSALFANSNKKNPRHKWTERDEACFGESIKPHQMMKEFDFEKNLALFNKKAVFEEINANQRPDVVKQTDRPNRNYKIEEVQSRFRQIAVPQTYYKEYITDEGMVVPSLTPSLLSQLLVAMEEAELTFPRQAELMGRAVAEVSIPLLGGPHRLNPVNSQQCPVVVVLAGSHRPGALAVNSARQLATQGVDTMVFLSHPTLYDENVNRELNLYRLTGQKITDNVNELPTSNVDLVIVGLADERTVKIPRPIVSWASDSKSVMLAIEPPGSGTPGIPVKHSLMSGLPVAHCQDNGNLFLVNLAVPQMVFTRLNIRYRSPFGSKFVIPLHPKE
ncbi:enhancer of mRNA-decapping protein 3-like [Macrosteles quadrilineatus]|uniref:enhancer of mRNA-decapping protein 3-like n=1 Tax=Macrosteles quadrilineatus TaxID=74068 RepID=UPI0023E18B6B|nr:enhancer of mRNA-decapping protein 3-like [Macrosteles quadrilineatus]